MVRLPEQLGDLQPVVAQEPRATIVGQPEHRRGQLLYGRAVDERAPHVGTELYVHAGLVRAGQLGVRLHDALEHQQPM